MNVPKIHFDYMMEIPGSRELFNKMLSGEVNPGVLAKHSVTGANNHAMALSYVHHGSQVYTVSRELQTMLSCTSLKGVRPEDIHLPWPCFYVACESSPFTVHGGATGQHQLSGFYVTSATFEEGVKGMLLPPTETHGMDGIHLHFWGDENHKSRFPGDDAGAWFTVSFKELMENFGGDWQAHLDDSCDRWTQERDFLDRDGVDVLEDGTVRVDVDKMQAQGAVMDPVSPVGLLESSSTLCKKHHSEKQSVDMVLDTGLNIHNLKSRLRFAVNLLFYIVSSESDVEMGDHPDRRKRIKLNKKMKKAKQRKNNRQIRKLTTALNQLSPVSRMTYVGAGLKRDPKVREFIREMGDSGDLCSGRIYVAGHFQEYWTGSRVAPDGTARKGEKKIKKWKEPHVRNEEMADIVDKRIHKVV
jgi:hypothetical protein